MRRMEFEEESKSKRSSYRLRKMMEFEEESKSKLCTVFGVDMDSRWEYKSVNFYAFDNLFNSQVEDEEACVTNERRVVKIADDRVVSRPFTTLNACHLGARYVCVDDIIYRIGGSCLPWDICVQIEENRQYSYTVDEERLICDFSTSVDYCDPFNVDGDAYSWKELPFALTQDRKEPHLLALGSNLYVAGGLFKCWENKLFMEVLDTKNPTAGWVAIPDPPKKHLDQIMFASAVFEKEGKLLFGSTASRRFYAYVPASSSWERCRHLKYSSLLDGCTNLPGVVVGCHSLWLHGISGTTLIGLDLYKGSYFSLNLGVEGVLPSQQCYHYNPWLFHTGGDNVAILFRDKISYELQADLDEEKEKSTEEVEEEEQTMQEVSTESSTDEEEDEETKENMELEAEETKKEKEEEQGFRPVRGLSFEEGSFSSSSIGGLSSDFDEEERAAMELEDSKKFGGLHCYTILVDFSRAHQVASGGYGFNYIKSSRPASGCVTVTSRSRLIGPNAKNPVSAAFHMNLPLSRRTSGDDASYNCKRNMGQDDHYGESSVLQEEQN